MNARENPAANKSVEQRTCVSSGNKNAFKRFPSNIPLDRNSMCCVFRAKPPTEGKEAWTYRLESYQTNPANCKSVHDLGTKRLWKKRLHHDWIDSIVRKYASVDCSPHDRKLHSMSFEAVTGPVNRCEGLVLGYGTHCFEHSVAPVGYANFFGPNVESLRAYSVHLGDRSAVPCLHCLSIIRQLQPALCSVVSRKFRRKVVA